MVPALERVRAQELAGTKDPRIRKAANSMVAAKAGEERPRESDPTHFVATSMPDDPDGWQPAGTASLPKRLVQNEREAHAGSA